MNFYNNKVSDFKKVFEEVVLVENGVEGSCGVVEISCLEFFVIEFD